MGCHQFLTSRTHCRSTSDTCMEVKQSADGALALVIRVVSTKPCYKDSTIRQSLLNTSISHLLQGG